IASYSNIGCLICDSSVYSYNCIKVDEWQSMNDERKYLFFVDVQTKGIYPYYMHSFFKSKGINIEIIENDKEILKHTVDFVTFSYYASRTSIADISRVEKNEGNIIVSA